MTTDPRRARQTFAEDPEDKPLVANLAAREDELGEWTSVLLPQPPVSWTEEGQLYGSPDW